jgi:outer membrane protein assembly factor BamD
MLRFKFIYLLIIIAFVFSCSKKTTETLNIKKASQDLEIITVYNDAYENLKNNDPYVASRKFLEAELLYPQSLWAPRSALMASYAFYLQNYYSEAISNLNRYLKTYPSDKNLPYAYYLIAMCNYEMIEDEKRDIGPLIEAKKNFNIVVERYPNTDFALDAEFKLEYIEVMLASKEMYLGRHYQNRNKWIAAINRFQNVTKNYSQTIFVEEALHRLVEINYKLGLKDEAQKYANILGYNYLSSQWYEKSYKIFNKKYKKKLPTNQNDNKKGVIEKFKKLFD